MKNKKTTHKNKKIHTHCTKNQISLQPKNDASDAKTKNGSFHIPYAKEKNM